MSTDCYSEIIALNYMRIGYPPGAKQWNQFLFNKVRLPDLFITYEAKLKATQLIVQIASIMSLWLGLSVLSCIDRLFQELKKRQTTKVKLFFLCILTNILTR